MEEFPAHPADGPRENRRIPKQASAFTKALEKTALEKEGILGVNAIILKPMIGKIDFEHANPFLSQAAARKLRFEEIPARVLHPTRSVPTCMHAKIIGRLCIRQDQYKRAYTL